MNSPPSPLTTLEQQRLRRALWISVLGNGALLAVVIALITLIGKPDLLGDRGQVGIAMAILIGWLWLLRNTPQQMLKRYADVKTNAAATATGLSVLSQRPGIGVFAPTTSLLTVGPHTFIANTFEVAALYPGQIIQARFAPTANVLLSVQCQTACVDPVIPDRAMDLSDRERELLALLAAGLSDKLIARQLELSPATIRTYNSSLFQKLGVTNRAEAVEAARNAGLLGSVAPLPQTQDVN